MKGRYLFPYRSRFIGLWLILIHIPIKVIWQTKNPRLDFHSMPSSTEDSVLFTTAHLFFICSTLLVLIGLFLIAFAKEKIEDEQILQLRLDSLRWAIYLNYVLLILSLIFTNGINFIDILRLNLWIPLLFFIIRFRWVIFRLNRSLT